MVCYAEIRQGIQGRSGQAFRRGWNQAGSRAAWCGLFTRSQNGVRSASYGDHAFVVGGIHRDAPLDENERKLIKENAELSREH